MAPILVTCILLAIILVVALVMASKPKMLVVGSVSTRIEEDPITGERKEVRSTSISQDPLGHQIDLYFWRKDLREVVLITALILVCVVGCIALAAILHRA